MNKKFRGGRLTLTKDGTIRKLELENGGGTRFCTWDDNDMDFDTVHRRLLNIFNLNDSKYKTSLYDFQYRLLDVNKYENFSQYMNTYGLSANSTVVYLCTHEVNDEDEPQRIMTKTKDKVTMKTTTTKQKASTSIKNEWLVDNQQASSQQPLDQSSLGNQLIIYYLYDKVLYLEYSFEKSSNDLIKNVRDLINQNSFDEILIQLFQYVCIIHGYVCSTIELLKEKLKQSNEIIQLMHQSEIELYSNSFNDINDVCQSTKTLLKLNKKQFGHIEIFSMMNKSFSQFYDHLKSLHKQWLENVEKNNKLNTSSSIHSNVKSIFSYSHTPSSSSQDHFEINTEDSIKQSQILPMSACQTLPSTDLFKSVSSLQESTDEETKEKSDLFKLVLNCSNHLLNLLHPQRLSKFRELVLSMIGDIESVRSTINLHDEHSLRYANREISSIRNQINKTFNDPDINNSKCELDQQLDISCNKTLKAIELLLTSLTRYQMQLGQNNRKEYSNWSSPPRAFIDQEQSDNRQSIRSNKQKLSNLYDDDQNSVVSSSLTHDGNILKNFRKERK
ncbi:unnamed protein product [Rotaria sordida]|uniref:Uncharacterized protein n=1 Tax=Rotaria sordida TaxID=392033 RepID=A0A814LNQ9_9BILA|nr:unnamed protein product [Rotaria sordida]